MKRRSLITLLVALALILSVGAPALAEDTIKIGGIGVLSGDYGKYGIAVREGVDLYVKQINAAGGVLGKPVEVLWEDTQADAATAISVFYRLKGQGIVAVIGGVLSGESIALGQVTFEENPPFPQISASASHPDVTAGRSNVFRTCFLDPFQAKSIAQYMFNEGVKKAAVMYDNANDYSKGLYDNFVEKCAELGVEIVAEASAAYGEKDFKTQLTTIQAAGPEAVFLPYYGAEAALILAQANEIGLNVRFFGADGIADIVTAIADKNLLTNISYTDHFSTEAESEMAVNFVKAFQEEYGRLPDISSSATGYDAAMVLCSAIQAAGSTDSDAIVAALKATDITAVSGKITFDGNNNPIKSTFLNSFNAQGEKVFITQVDP